jgi:hypothetical protein
MEMIKSRSFRPEWILGILTLLGLVYYAEVWIGYLAFYRSLGMTPETAGVRYPALVVPFQNMHHLRTTGTRHRRHASQTPLAISYTDQHPRLEALRR